MTVLTPPDTICFTSQSRVAWQCFKVKVGLLPFGLFCEVPKAQRANELMPKV
jgi:hypothetical protein